MKNYTKTELTKLDKVNLSGILKQLGEWGMYRKDEMVKRILELQEQKK